MTTKTPHPLLGVEVHAETDEELIEAESDLLLKQCSSLADRDESTWLPDWYMKVLEETKAMETKIKEQSRGMLKQLKARRQALHFRFGSIFESIVKEVIMSQGGTRKSVKFMGGTAGYRKAKDKIIVTDEAAFRVWFDDQDNETRSELQKAFDLKLARKTPILDFVLATGVMPDGIEFEPAHEKFFPAPETPQLTRE